MISDARGGHVSPGIYTEEKDVTYSVKSLGITSLGLAGETLYGPAFEPISVENWSDYVDYFGGCSTEKFKGTGLPKYELPYIAKSYLEESKRLTVVRVLGLSGYHAGPAYVISTGENAAPVVVLRSKMLYGQNSETICQEAEDNPVAVVKSIEVKDYISKVYDSVCVATGSSESTEVKNAGKFTIVVECNENTVGFNSAYTYSVSLNPSDSDYIYNVLSNDPSTGTTPVYIEAVYEASWDKKSKMQKGKINGENDMSVEHSKFYALSNPTIKDKVLVEGTEGTSAETIDTAKSTYEYDAKEISEGQMLGGTLITVNVSDFIKIDDRGYGKYSTLGNDKIYLKMVKSESYAAYDDFLEEYRPAQTPWVVSDASINGESGEVVATMHKLFKFITISDGDASNFQVKVSIQNIRPDEGTFDVVVRDFNDTDAGQLVLEKFSKCNLVEGDSNYIAYKIGTSDGGYASKSKYITVEMADGEDLSKSIPAGFLGYPMPKYGNNRTGFVFKYNNTFNTGIKPKRQFFGVSDIVGIDEDIFKYKGRLFYTNGDSDPDMICNGFHMDSALNKAINGGSVYVDGIPYKNWTTVSEEKVGSEKYAPRLLNIPYIDETIYKDVNLRKFTMCFYGGFDGWDVNRDSRTNTDKFKASKYNVDGSTVFSHVSENGLNTLLNLPSTAITTDYYAYLAGYRKFANPEDVDINLFATPGINWFDNMLLTEDAIDVIEDTEDGRGGDALYIMNAPTGDYDPSELASMFKDTEINSSYACTYAPWIMYLDSSNKRYLKLPVTKDVVRNMAATDNNSYPWFAPAGIERGDVKCVKADYKTTLSQEDDLYEACINPVKTFAQDGVKIWGNKTAYDAETPLNRINVRRLMIRVKKLVKNAALKLVFEQYDDTLEQQFRGIVDPILAEVKSNRGIYDYRILTEVTAETRDQHILPAKILIKPTPALEFISLSFVVYPESVQFDEN